MVKIDRPQGKNRRHAEDPQRINVWNKSGPTECEVRGRSWGRCENLIGSLNW